jgi:uncharacterized protein with NRDE domain
MCTITYLPFQDGYIVTQNRDESPLRAEAIFPVKEKINGSDVIFPQDPEGTGSWFVSAANGLTLCIMNGAFHPNKQPGDYKHSRGLVPLHFIELGDEHNFVNTYHYRELEAFTLLVCSPNGVSEFIWNEQKMQVVKHAPKALIFQSAPLYNYKQQKHRTTLFTRFLERHDAHQIIDFHTKPQAENPMIDIRMDRAQVKSISTIQRMFNANTNQVAYMPLATQQLHVAPF